MSSQAREAILGSIKKSLAENSLPMPFPEAEMTNELFTSEDISLEEKFAQEFTALGGKFIYCADEQELIEQLNALNDTMNWKQIHVKDQFLQELFREHNLSYINESKSLKDIEVGLSLCECLVARTGSLILSSGQEHGRALPVYSPIHIAVAFSNQLVWNISNAINFLKEKYNNQLPSLVSLTTGPSRTADIEKTLVVGVHGPKEVYVFLVDKNWKR